MTLKEIMKREKGAAYFRHNDYHWGLMFEEGVINMSDRTSLILGDDDFRKRGWTWIPKVKGKWNPDLHAWDVPTDFYLGCRCILLNGRMFEIESTQSSMTLRGKDNYHRITGFYSGENKDFEKLKGVYRREA